MATDLAPIADPPQGTTQAPGQTSGSAGILPASEASGTTINTPAGMPALPGQVEGNEKVIIIGAGIAGLACGCYLQMNGIQTEILEASLLPGGLCTAWHRGPYVFDGCLRWLIGT